MFESQAWRGPNSASNPVLTLIAVLVIAASASCSKPAASSPAATPAAAKLTPDSKSFEVAPGSNPFEVSTDDLVQSALSNLDDIKSPARNPFDSEWVTGLPPNPSPYLSGPEFFLSVDQVRQIIQQVFEQAGYRLTTRHFYQRGDVALVADGFDVDKKIGFVVCHNGNLDGDWWNPQLAAADTETAIHELLQRVTTHDNSANPQLASDIHAAKALPDPARREAAYRAILARAAREKISRADMRQLEPPLDNGHDFIAVVSPYDMRFSVKKHVDYTSKLEQQLDPSTKSKFSGETQEINREEILKGRERNAVEALQQAVREYIVWARSQGAE